MSWDIFVQDLPRDVKSFDDMPDDFQPSPIGHRSKIIEQIVEVIPNANFSDPSWGIIDGNDWSIEVSMGNDEICDGFAFHIRGGETAVGFVAAILDRLGLRAFDPQSGGFFEAGPAALDSFRKWRAYRDQVMK